MSIEELDAAITGPAAAVGVGVEPSVVSEMVGEILDRPGALPLLQFTLTELFEDAGRPAPSRSPPTAPAVACRARWPGGPTRSSPASGRTTPRPSGTCSSGWSASTTTAPPTRRRALVVEVDELDRARVDRVLETFGRHRLLTFDRDPVDAWPDRRDLPRGAAHRVGDAARLDRRRIATTCEPTATSSPRCTPGPPPAGRRTTSCGAARLDASLAWAGDDDDGAAAGGARVPRRQRRRSRRGAATRRVRRSGAPPRRAARAATDAAVGHRRHRDGAGRRARRRWRGCSARTPARPKAARPGTRAGAAASPTSSVLPLSRDPELSLLLGDRGGAVRPPSSGMPSPRRSMPRTGRCRSSACSTTSRRTCRRRPGSDLAGSQGVWVLPVDELLRFAAGQHRSSLTAEECHRYLGTACPHERTVGRRISTTSAAPMRTPAPSAIDEAEVVSPSAPGSTPRSRTGNETSTSSRALRPRHPASSSPDQRPTLTEATAQRLRGRRLPPDQPRRPSRHRRARGPLLDLRPLIDEATLLEDYGQYLVVADADRRRTASGRATDGPIHGVVVGLDSKALIWTKRTRLHRSRLPARRPTGQSFRSLADTDGRRRAHAVLPRAGSSARPTAGRRPTGSR